MQITIDPATGLPSLPDHFFWRVTPKRYGYFNLELRRKGRIGSKLYHLQPIDKYAVKPERIKQVAYYVMQHVVAKWPTADETANRKNFIGDYPPKSINANNQDA